MKHSIKYVQHIAKYITSLATILEVTRIVSLFVFLQNVYLQRATVNCNAFNTV